MPKTEPKADPKVEPKTEPKADPKVEPGSAVSAIKYELLKGHIYVPGNSGALQRVEVGDDGPVAFTVAAKDNDALIALLDDRKTVRRVKA